MLRVASDADHLRRGLILEMRKTLLSLLAGAASVAALGSAAFAADLPARSPPPAPYVAVPVFTWAGAYFGVNAGAAWSDNQTDTFRDVTLFAGSTPIGGLTTLTSRSSGSDAVFAGGGQIGYNWQFGGWVTGIEADIQGLASNRSRDNGIFGVGNSVFTASNGTQVALFNNTGVGASARSLDWFGTVRGRLGYAWDRVLVYGTGGFAFTDRGNDNRVVGSFGSTADVPNSFFTPGGLVAVRTNPFGGTAVVASRSNNDTGYAVGGGIEYAFTPNLTAKIEGLYVNFGHKDRGIAGNTVIGVTPTGAPVSVASTSIRSKDDDFAVVRAGLNWKFNAF
jgi:outer membrane immunogenic protein